jgi:hypothetical protein
MKSLIFFNFCGSFYPPNPDPDSEYGFGSTNPIESGSNSNPPTHKKTEKERQFVGRAWSQIIRPQESLILYNHSILSARAWNTEQTDTVPTVLEDQLSVKNVPTYLLDLHTYLVF